MPGYGKTTFNRINPDEVLKQYAPDPEMMMPDPIIALKQVQMAAGWEKLLENLYKDNSMVICRTQTSHRMLAAVISTPVSRKAVT